MGSEIVYQSGPFPTDASKGSVSCDVNHVKEKEEKLTKSFEELLSYDSQLEIAYGKNPTNVQERIDARFNSFLSVAITEKKIILNAFRIDLTNKMNSCFVTNLNLYDELRVKTNGADSLELSEDYEKKRNKFHQSKINEKINLTIAMKDQAEDYILSKFDYLLGAWSESLREMGATEEEIKIKIEATEDRFLNAEKIGQIGIAKTLKDNIDTASRSSFHPQNELYAKLRQALGVTEDSDDFPSPEKYQETFNNTSYQGRARIINSQQSRINQLLSLVGANRNKLNLS